MAQGQEPFGTSAAFCTSCGKGFSEAALFCPYCGKRTGVNSAFCAHCGTATQPGDRFCPTCGAAAGVDTSQTSVLGVVAEAEVEYMGFWIRVVAAIIDGVLLSVAGYVLGLIGLGFFSFFIGWVYAVLFIGLKGQTIGKMALSIQVVDAEGNVPGIGRAILREIIGKFVSAIVIFLGYLWVGWDRQKRGWHDHIAGTYVIRSKPRPNDTFGG
jgi:uncharacterized RDD family membrane protein YckC/RNA polymerase subunit RPABC4/transcription elongation factor Spt4